MADRNAIEYRIRTINAEAELEFAKEKCFEAVRSEWRRCRLYAVQVLTSDGKFETWEVYANNRSQASRICEKERCQVLTW